MRERLERMQQDPEIQSKSDKSVEEQLDDFFDKLDKDQNNKITFYEYKFMWVQPKNKLGTDGEVPGAEASEERGWGGETGRCNSTADGDAPAAEGEEGSGGGGGGGGEGARRGLPGHPQHFHTVSSWRVEQQRAAHPKALHRLQAGHPRRLPGGDVTLRRAGGGGGGGGGD